MSRLFEFSGENSASGGFSDSFVNTDSDFNGAAGTIYLEYVDYKSPPSEQYYEGRTSTKKLILDNKNQNHDLPTVLFQEPNEDNITLDILESVNHAFLELAGNDTKLIVHKFEGDKTGLLHLQTGQKLYSEFVASTTGYSVAPVSYQIDPNSEVFLPSTVIMLGTRTQHAGRMTGVYNLTVAQGALVVFYSTAQTAVLENGKYMHLTKPGNISYTSLTVQSNSKCIFTDVANGLTLSIVRFAVKYKGEVYMNRGTIVSDHGIIESLGLLSLAGEGYSAEYGPGAGIIFLLFV